MYYVVDDALYFYDNASGADTLVALSDTAGWWKIGHEPDALAWTFVDPNAEPGESAVFRLGDETASYAQLEDLLRQAWSGEQYAVAFEERASLAADEARRQMTNLRAVELLQEFRRPSLLERLITREFFPPGPASADLLDDTEARIGHRLPRDHRDVLGVHNGFSQASLLPAEEIQLVSTVAAPSIEYLVEIAKTSGDPEFSAADLETCWVIGGRLQPIFESDAAEVFASLVWCPEASYDYRYLSTISSQFHPTFTEALREYLIQMRSF